MEDSDFEAGDLVYYEPSLGEPYQGLILDIDRGLVKIYRFESRDIVHVARAYCHDFIDTDYLKMCDKSWWSGLIALTRDLTHGELIDGRVVSETALELLLQPDDQTEPTWVNLDNVCLTGHILAQPGKLMEYNLAKPPFGK